MTHLFEVIGLGVLFAMLSLLAKESGSKTTAAQVAFAGVALFGFAFVRFLPVFSEAKALFEKLSLEKEGVFLLKAVGVGYVSQIGGDVCRDLGAESVAAKIELCGRAELLLLSLPLFAELLELSYSLVG
ncbi:MAG: hypothetical protein J6R40_03495 [Clostridia bacterium]|nr:hypothetical protein [Clostridia bacterium]